MWTEFKTLKWVSPTKANMKRFVAAIGFTAHRVTRGIIASGINAGDRVVLVRPTDSSEHTEERSSNAVNDVRSMLSGVVQDVSVTTERVDSGSFEAALNDCSEIVTREPPPVVCLGGGPSELRTAMTVAATAHASHVAGTVLYGDLNSNAEAIDVPELATDFPGRTRDTFAHLVDFGGDEVSLQQIADASDAARSTINRHLNSLEDRGYVTSRKPEKSKYVSLTLLGRLTARNAKL
jgi:CRISPR locus-related DNA-binding protein